jgi:hypothetical protein
MGIDPMIECDEFDPLENLLFDEEGFRGTNLDEMATRANERIRAAYILGLLHGSELE